MRKIDLVNFQVATNETAREINSRAMLNLVREHQPISRADLMRYSGLQRSTVSVITGQLIADRWLKQGATGHSPRGRKPVFLCLNSERCGVVGVDIQPDITRFALADIDNRFLAQGSIPTEKNPEQLVARLGRRINNLLQAHPHISYEGVGISLPGRTDSSPRQLISSPALGWSEVDLRSMLEHNVGLPVELENAANACALAELWSGRHRTGVHNLVAVVVSDEIGVGMILNGRLVRGANGTAGEFGHVTLVPDGSKCRCGNTGCWEVLASNAAAVRYYSESAPAGKGSSDPAGNAARMSFSDILRLADRNDFSAGKALNRMAYYLGAGIAMLVTGLAPDVLIVAGEVTRAWTRVWPIVADAVKCHAHSCAATRIVAADPESPVQLRGAIALVLRKHFDSPLMG